ncbi:MAG TPA: hypothetical protein VGZ02_06950 [Candidatus Baltobacteraceae bacterium]|nr:hypothetical protein [Candidatus Baltobacteraceae bacterium]
MVFFTGVTAVCVVAFIGVAFVLRGRMKRLHAVYETRLHTLLAAEIVLLHEGRSPDVDDIEREIRQAVQNSAVMKKNAQLFRLLWPSEFDKAFYSGERVIAQASRIVALAGRTGSTG